MNVNKICSLGYFDNVIVDGYMLSMFNTKGIEITDNTALVDIVTNSKYSSQGIAKLRFTVYGESEFNLADDDLLGMRWHREMELGLKKTKVDNKDRYPIGYADILILKSENSLSDMKNVYGDVSEYISTITKSEDEFILLKKAVDIQSKIKRDSSSDSNIAIVDRVYIDKAFRGCKISSWIHENIFDIIKTYCMINTYAALLIPGDFSNEAESMFGVSKDEYRNMLVKHYKASGYKFIDKAVMCKYNK